QEREGVLENGWDECEGEEAIAVEFGLAREFMSPLATGKLDPFIGIIGALAELQSDEIAVFQVIFQRLSNPWVESITQSVTHVPAPTRTASHSSGTRRIWPKPPRTRSVVPSLPSWCGLPSKAKCLIAPSALAATSPVRSQFSPIPMAMNSSRLKTRITRSRTI